MPMMMLMIRIMMPTTTRIMLIEKISRTSRKIKKKIARITHKIMRMLKRKIMKVDHSNPHWANLFACHKKDWFFVIFSIFHLGGRFGSSKFGLGLGQSSSPASNWRFGWSGNFCYLFFNVVQKVLKIDRIEGPCHLLSLGGPTDHATWHFKLLLFRQKRCRVPIHFLRPSRSLRCRTIHRDIGQVRLLRCCCGRCGRYRFGRQIVPCFRKQASRGVGARGLSTIVLIGK